MKRVFLFCALLICLSGKIFSQDFVWAKLIGDNGNDAVGAIDVDPLGNIVMAGGGHFQTNDTTVVGTYQSFLSKINAAGQVQWVKTFPGNFNPSRIKIDHSGNIYIGGLFSGSLDFDPSPGTYNLAPPHMAFYLLKLDLNGNFMWVKTINFDNSNESIDLKIVDVDPENNVWIGGGYLGANLDFDLGPGVYTLDSAAYWNDWNSFIVKSDSTGDMIWAANIDSSVTNSIAFDPDSNVIITGYTYGKGDYYLSTDTFYFSTSPGSFFAKLTPSGNLIWVRGGVPFAENDFWNNLVTDGDIYSIGFFSGTQDFDPGWDTHYLTSIGVGDLAILKLSKFGDFLWAHNIGPRDLYYYPASIQLDAYHNVFVSGQFQETVDFDFGPNVYSNTSVGSSDMFVAKYNTFGDFLWFRTFGDNTHSSLNQMHVDTKGGITIAGTFYGTTMDCDPSLEDSILTLNSFASNDIFIIKWIDSTSMIGLEDINEDPFKVYPNPFHDQITVSGIDELTQIQLCNSMGGVIQSFKLSSTNPSVPLVDLPSGIYFLRLQTKEHFITKKIIKN